MKNKQFIIATIAGILILGLIILGAVSMMKGGKTYQKPREQKITVIQAPPPPPPPKIEEPPPPEEQPIETPPEPEPVAEEPAAEPDEAPAGDDLGVDGDGSGSGDDFGLVGKKGGRGLIGGGDANRWYAGLVQQELQRLLSDNSQARSSKYSVIVKLWITETGNVERYEFNNRIENKQSEAAVIGIIERLQVSDVPEALPQPMKLRISSR